MFAMETYFFIRGICKSDMGYLGIIHISHFHLCCKETSGFENVQFLMFWKLVSMVTRLLQGNTIQIAYFIFTLKCWIQRMCCPKQSYLFMQSKENSYHKSQCEKCQFHIFPWATLHQSPRNLSSHANHCQKKGMLCFVKVFQQVCLKGVIIIDLCHKSLITICMILRSPYAWFLVRMLVITLNMLVCHFV